MNEQSPTAVNELDKLLNAKQFSAAKFGKVFKTFSDLFGWFDDEGNAATPFIKLIIEGAKVQA